MPLNDLTCRAAKPDAKAKKLADGGGLYLHVMPTGSKIWRMDYRINGARKTATFGPYPEVKLADARAHRDEAKRKLRGGVDPTAKGEDLRFSTVANNWFATNRAKWKTGYSARMWKRIEDNVLPAIGEKNIRDIEPSDILVALRDVEERGAVYSAKRIRAMISTIFRFAISEGTCKINPAADVGDALKPTPRTQHRKALREEHLTEFFRRLAVADANPETRLGLELVAHTFVRPNEIRFAQWDEFVSDVWIIPADRMKMNLEHRVPLTRRSLDILQQLRSIRRSEKWVFPNDRNPRLPMSENCLLYCLYRMGYRNEAGVKVAATVHGFRGTASTILNESGLFVGDWVERQLAHVPENKVRSAYNAAEYWPQRVEMMRWYSDLLERHKIGTPPGNLTGLLV